MKHSSQSIQRDPRDRREPRVEGREEPAPGSAGWQSAGSRIANPRHCRLTVRATKHIVVVFAFLIPTAPLVAQELPGTRISVPSAGNYASNVIVIREAQEQALAQAREMLDRDENPRTRTALEAAVKEMERSKAMLEEAGKTPVKLSAALAAQQSAYQALLKLMPREYRMTRSRNGGQNAGAGQPNRRELDQLEMTGEENRYETERTAMAPTTPQQRERGQAADRLKQLAQRQQDMNDRLRELQTALQEARTDQEREEIRRQLKRLREEERRMLSDVDELRQKLDQSQNPDSLAGARQQLDRTRADVERAARELESDSVSQALAAGARAQQSMQNLREDLRRKSSSQFAEQMRQLRSQARDLSRQEDQLAHGLESLGQQEHKTLDDSAQRQELIRQMTRQQSALTNLLAGMRTLTEQAESTEPLLSHQLYDALRRADQERTDNLFEMGLQLVDRGFLPQAAKMERSAARNIEELRQGVERAAESVLGNEADALRYARRQLDDLTRQVEREMAGAGTNPSLSAASQNEPNAPQRAAGKTPSPDAAADEGAPRTAGANNPSDADGSQPAGNGSRPGNGRSASDAQASTQNGSSAGRDGASPSRNGRNPGNRNGGDGRLRQLAEQLGRGGGSGDNTGPITGSAFSTWSDRMRDVEEVLDSPGLRNQLATARERVGAFRGNYRQYGRVPETEAIRSEILVPMTQVRVWLQEELARLDDANSLVPLDRDPVPDNYSELVRRYYEKLGSAQ